VFVDWQVSNPNARGHLTLHNYPKNPEYGQTYKVEITITSEQMDWGDTIEFQEIHWLIDCGSGNIKQLGYSIANTQLNKNSSITIISHWSLPEQPFTPAGQLIMQTSVIIHSNQTSETKQATDLQINPIPQFQLKIKGLMTLNLSSQAIIRLDTLTTYGSLSTLGGGAKINITYVAPDGLEVNRATVTDEKGNYKDKYVPDKVGTWSVKASWGGNENYTAISTQTLAFTVTPEIPVLLIAAGGLIFFFFAVAYYVPARIKKREMRAAYPPATSAQVPPLRSGPSGSTQPKQDKAQPIPRITAVYQRLKRALYAKIS
jgi:hypothetical protein